MNNNKCEVRLVVDERQVLKMFGEFNKRKRQRVFRAAIRDSLNIVKKKATSNLRGVINPRMMSKKDKWGNTFRKGIKVSVAKDAMSGKVHIMGNFKLKFFQMGTDERRVKKFKKRRYARGTGPKRGRIKASHFYTNAVNSEERRVFSNLNDAIRRSIIKINNKYKH